MVQDKRTETNNLQGDIWTEDDDVMLAETILRNVRNGKTVMDGCREMEQQTEGKRTASASKFRWFTKLVDQYKAGYELAKQEGKAAKERKKKKVNKGERFEEIMQTVLEKTDEVEKEVSPDDFVILAKKFKQQQEAKEKSLSNNEKQINELTRKVQKLEGQLKDAKKEADFYAESLMLKQKDYNKVIEALQTLKTLGIQIQIPEPESPKYTVDKDGVVSKKD